MRRIIMPVMCAIELLPRNLPECLKPGAMSGGVLRGVAFRVDRRVG